MLDITLSVVIYNDYETPADMIRSFREFMPTKLSTLLYVVDNSDCESPDRGAFIEEIDNYPFIEYMSSGSNVGFGAANNLALSRAESKYHVFINPDIQFRSNALEGLYSFMEDHQGVGVCIPRMVDEQGKGLPVYRREVTVLDAINRAFLNNALNKRNEYHTMALEDYTKPFRVPFGQGSFLFGRTGLLQRLGGFDDRFFLYLEDADLCKRINEDSSLWYCPDVTVMHRWERGSRKDTRLMLMHLKSYWKYFKKWGFKFW